MAQGKKFDEKKNPLELISAAAEWELAEVLKHGREKYDAWNWEDGIEYSRIIAAIKRHRNAIEMGEDYDEDSGLLHAAHLYCEAMFLLHFQLMGRLDLDDRRKYTGGSTVKGRAELNLDIVKEMAEKLNKEQPFKTAFEPIEPGIVTPAVTRQYPVDGCYCNICTRIRQEGK